MAKMAIIDSGGKQYLVQSGQQLSVEKLASNVKQLPDLLSGKLVSIEVIQDYWGPKVRVAKFRAKSRYKRTHGHRQIYTKIKIGAI